jgi:molecular chaperone GrpE
MKKNDKEKQNQEIENLKNQLKRAVADYQNLEKRVAGERSSWVRSANKDLILRFLPGLDNLMLAREHTRDEGVGLAIDHFLSALGKEGVEKIETIGQDFNPHLMEAVSTREGEEGKVVEELKVGYTLDGVVLRPAQVIVGSAKQNEGKN